ncbi:hypothetical protein FBU59_001387 [Linderina macrospora]|uniref:Uncharacterized protein n=1 Tax=Linderina macrospora TaxID=4868 RepID=A0ACC1JE21_9FUNG|nr:hypothetical protein FBU59_001387 [Linderina macrospora]
MWLDAVRDTAVIGVKPRDILDELDSLSQFTNTSAGKIAPDVGLGLSLGLESTYLGLVSKSLNTWYRYHLPLFLRSLSMLLSPETSGSGSHKVVSVLKSGHDELLGHLQNTLPVRIPSALDLQMPSQSSVLLLGFVLQEISRLSGLSLSNAFAKHLPNGHVGDPLIQPIINRLVTGALDIGGSDQSGQGDSESERIASLVQAGIPVFGPTSLTSNVGMKWASDIRLLSSLLSALCALLQQSGDLGFASLFAATATAGETARGSWLVDEIWKQAVAIPLRPLLASTSSSGKDQLSSFSRGDLNPVVKQQLDNCQMRVDVAVKALAVAQSLLDCLRAAREPINGQISGLSRWFFCGSTAVNSDSLIGSLGMTGFGNTVLADMFGVWKFARSQIVESNNGTEGDVGSITVLASQSLAVITEIIAEAVYSVTSDSVESQRSLVSLWLNLWQESVFVAGTPQTAFPSLHGFVSRVMDSHAATTQSYVDDILTGGSIDDDQGNSRTVQVVTAAVNRALLELLDSDEVSLATRSLALTAKLLAHDPSEPGHLVVAGDVATKFVSVFIAHLSDDTLLSAVLDVPGYMASPSKSTFAGFPAVLSLMPMLAKNAIPQLAAVVARNLPIPKADSSSVIDKSLGALVMFAATEYAEPRISESVLSTVLMLLLSMLPDNCSRLSTTEVKITESILSLAAASPTTFKSILLKLNASQPLAKRRLEAAIRSRAERGHDSDDDQEQVTATSSGEVSGRQTPMVSAGGGDKNVPGRIALKSDFAGF